MPESHLRLIKSWNSLLHKSRIKEIPGGLRGIYVLYLLKSGNFNVVYVGMSTSGIRGRLNSHSKKKSGLWTHFSIFEVWDNIRNEEITELEGLFREIYKKDSTANMLNKQRGFKKLKYVKKII